MSNLFSFRIFGSPFLFNTDNWFQEQNVAILAVDDDIIMDSPYGAMVSIESFSLHPAFNKENNVTILVAETDEGMLLIEYFKMHLCMCGSSNTIIIIMIIMTIIITTTTTTTTSIITLLFYLLYYNTNISFCSLP